MSTRDELKAAHERQVFAEFCRSADLRVDPSSIESRPQGEPDIRCVLDGAPTYFELGRLLDEGMQKLRLKAMRGAPKQVAADYANVKLPEREMLKAKLGKTYESAELSIELLLYYDNENWLVGDVPAIADFSWHAEHVMRPVIAAGPKLFRRVWVFERHRPSVLWKYST
jgi:hypothetical protein